MAQVKSFLPDLLNIVRGACMGAADVVPGVSGGTVALISGIYDQLVGAISRIDMQLFSLVKARRFRDAANHIDLRFLLTLAVGLGIGFIIMTATIHAIFNKSIHTYCMMLAVFSGMILMSAVFVARSVRRWNAATGSIAVVGMLLAGAMAFAETPDHAEGGPSMFYVFVSGSVAICAMILPGISGAMILMLLGVYHHLTEIPKKLLSGDDIGHGLLTIAVFGTGCVLSLILFSKFLRWLLHKYHDATMAAMGGFMVGALPKLWPFQRDLTPELDKLKLKKFELYIPELSEAIPVIIVAIVGAAFVYVVDRLSTRSEDEPLPQADEVPQANEA
jgi:putative membrane protein